VNVPAATALERERLRERLATVESRVKHIDLALERVEHDTRRIREALEKQRGFTAGFTAAFTLIWSALAGAVAFLWHRATGMT
jgi:hypothetical protein